VWGLFHTHPQPKSNNHAKEKMNNLFDNDELPATPYAGTSGWSGSDTSRERAKRNDANGTTSTTQHAILDAVESSGFHGMTIADIREQFPDRHHGTLSGALTVLHMEGHLLRLAAKRSACKIYVAPRYRSGRDIEQPTRNRHMPTACPHCGGDLSQ
jgi:hypothetical protein